MFIFLKRKRLNVHGTSCLLHVRNKRTKSHQVFPSALMCISSFMKQGKKNTDPKYLSLLEKYFNDCCRFYPPFLMQNFKGTLASLVNSSAHMAYFWNVPGSFRCSFAHIWRWFLQWQCRHDFIFYGLHEGFVGVESHKPFYLSLFSVHISK